MIFDHHSAPLPSTLLRVEPIILGSEVSEFGAALRVGWFILKQKGLRDVIWGSKRMLFAYKGVIVSSVHRSVLFIALCSIQGCAL